MSKHSANERFKDAVKHLKASGTIARYSDLAKDLGCSAQVLSEIMAGRMRVQVEMLQNFFIKFGISYDYIFKGVGPIIPGVTSANEPPIIYNSECPACAKKDRDISLLEKNASLYEFKIKILEDKISRLESPVVGSDISKTA